VSALTRRSTINTNINSTIMGKKKQELDLHKIIIVGAGGVGKSARTSSSMMRWPSATL